MPVALEGLAALQAQAATPDDLPGLIAQALFGETILATVTAPSTPLSSQQVAWC